MESICFGRGPWELGLKLGVSSGILACVAPRARSVIGLAAFVAEETFLYACTDSIASRATLIGGMFVGVAVAGIVIIAERILNANE